MKMKDLMLYRC